MEKMKKVYKLVECWRKRKHTIDDVISEYNELYISFCAIFENGLMSKERYEAELDMLNDAADLFTVLYNEEN